MERRYKCVCGKRFGDIELFIKHVKKERLLETLKRQVYIEFLKQANKFLRREKILQSKRT